jgi:hypothetical protein
VLFIPTGSDGAGVGGGREKVGREEGRKYESRSGSIPEYHWPGELRLQRLIIIVLHRALGQVNLCRQAGSAGSFLESLAPRQRHPKTIAAVQQAAGIVSGSRQEGNSVGSVGSMGSVGSAVSGSLSD